MLLEQIYQTLDALFPFSTQEKWDNSGLLVGSPERKINRVLTVLDIDMQSIAYAREWEYDLIIAHHPVIFDPLRTLPDTSPVMLLAQAGIAAICTHTPLDMGMGGLNDYAHELLERALPFSGEKEMLEESAPGVGTGFIQNLAKPMESDEIAAALRSLFQTEVRMSRRIAQVKRLAYCSGSGASLLELAAEKGADALITGDIKHDRWIAAQFLGVSLFDCGHYGTEIFAAKILRDRLRERLPRLNIDAYEAYCPYRTIQTIELT